jgi:hypothetical protein
MPGSLSGVPASGATTADRPLAPLLRPSVSVAALRRDGRGLGPEFQGRWEVRHSDRSVYLAAALFGAAAGAFFRGVFDPEVSRTPVNFVLSGFNGMIVALSMIAAHLWMTRHAADWLRRRSLAIELLADGGAMVAASVVAQIIAQLLLYGASPVQIASLMPSQVIFALVMAALFLAVAHIVRLIGARQFLSVLAGRYRRPVEELRIFLFVDLKGATHLAETLGPVRVAELIALSRCRRHDRRAQRRGARLYRRRSHRDLAVGDRDTQRRLLALCFRDARLHRRSDR